MASWPASAPYYPTTSGIANTVWLQWTGNVTVTAASTTIQVWEGWIQQTSAGVSLQPASVSYQQTDPAAAEKYRREKAERARKLEKARKRARKLLVDNLSDPQREEFERDGFFHVETRDGQRRYRLGPRAVPIRVHGEDGSRWSYCIHPLTSFPAEDVALALKLMLENDEEEFLRIANASRVR